MHLQSALEFIHQNGSAVELARLKYLLKGEAPSLQVTAKLLSGQRANGGWPPFWAQEYSSLDATCFRLAQAHQLGLLPTDPRLAQALRFLVERQRPDESWEEDMDMGFLAPPWARPGDLAARLYLTANCAYWLAVLAAAPEAARRGANALYKHMDATHGLPSFYHTHWLAAGLWRCLDWEGPVSQVIGYLHSHLDKLAASNLGWMLVTLLDTGLPFDHPLLVDAAQRLEHLQQADGRWSSEDGLEQDMHATLEALRALRLCGRW